jgi:tetratricopeptide (TPR) repeat protein
MKKLVFSIIIFTCFIAFNLNAQDTNDSMDPKAATHYNQAIQFMKAEQYEDALKSIDSSLVIAKYYKSYYLQGQAYLKLKNASNAAISFKESVKLNPNFEAGWMASGNANLAAKEYEQALDDFKKAAEVTKDANVKIKAEESIQIAMNGISTNFYNQANELSKQNKYEEAILIYEKALTVTNNENLKTNIKESISKTCLAAGNSSYKDKKYDKSIEWMQKSISNSPSDRAYLGLTKAYIEKKKYAEALTSLETLKTVQKTVTDGAIAYYKGLIYLNKGEDSKATESFNTALSDSTYKKVSQSQIDYLKAKQKETKQKK